MHGLHNVQALLCISATGNVNFFNRVCTCSKIVRLCHLFLTSLFVFRRRRPSVALTAAQSCSPCLCTPLYSSSSSRVDQRVFFTHRFVFLAYPGSNTLSIGSMSTAVLSSVLQLNILYSVMTSEMLHVLEKTKYPENGRINKHGLESMALVEVSNRRLLNLHQSHAFQSVLTTWKNTFCQGEPITVRSCGVNLWFAILLCILLFSPVELSQPSIALIQSSVEEI